MNTPPLMNAQESQFQSTYQYLDQQTSTSTSTSAFSNSSSPTSQDTHLKSSHSHSHSHSPSSKSSATNQLPQTPSSFPTGSGSGIRKRELNTLAARRYRQRRVDQVSDLEATLKETVAERDDLKTRVARLEGELDVLRKLMGTKV